MNATRAAVRIEGRGPVALALALFLARQGFEAGSVSLDPLPTDLPPPLASRSLALSLGSWQLLSRVALPAPAAPIARVEVSLRGHAGRTRIQATDLNAPALGYVLRYGALHRALSAALGALGARVPAAPPDAGDRSTDAPLTVIADGDPGDASRARDFDQTALLAEVISEHDGHGTAFERFTDEGPLALLPLPEARRYALVWCGRPERSAQRAALESSAFADALLDAFGDALGSLRLAGERTLTPLERRVRARLGDARQIAIGNAAQALHPVAGQGLNLGLRDAFELAQQLGELRAARRPLTDAAPRFARARSADRGLTVALTDTLAQVFTIPALAGVESLALDALDLAAPARHRLAEALMFGLRAR